MKLLFSLYLAGAGLAGLIYVTRSFSRCNDNDNKNVPSYFASVAANSLLWPVAFGYYLRTGSPLSITFISEDTK